MASDEFYRRQGLLLEKEQKAQHLAIKIHGMRDRIRRMTDPHRPIDEVNLSELRVEMDAYTEAQQQRETLIREIKALREDMGLPRYESR
ncbi:MAG TPA: hypothetical protein PKN47_01670 [Nitrospira sp.]|nr:hypothetical protein [Nitrospira sp.]